MKEGDLVRYVGAANTYKGRLGVVCRLYNTHGTIKNKRPAPPNSALVYFAGLENAGRADPGQTQRGTVSRRSPHKSGLHPMALDELEVVKK